LPYSDLPIPVEDTEYRPPSPSYSPHSPPPSRSPTPALPPSVYGRPYTLPLARLGQSYDDWINDRVPPSFVDLLTIEEDNTALRTSSWLQDQERQDFVHPPDRTADANSEEPLFFPESSPEVSPARPLLRSRPLRREPGFFDVTNRPGTPVVSTLRRTVREEQVLIGSRRAPIEVHATSDVVSSWSGYGGPNADQLSESSPPTYRESPTILGSSPTAVEEERRANALLGLQGTDRELVEVARHLILFTSGRAERAIPRRITLARDLVVTIIVSATVAVAATYLFAVWRAGGQSPCLSID
jgi:hypothetical protein